MKVVITEEQYRMVLNEGFNDRIKSIASQFNDLVKKIVNDVKNQFGVSTRFALTYGAGIGALMEPVMKYLHNEFEGLEPWQVSSLVVAAISIVFYEGRDYLKLQKELSQQGLDEELQAAVSKTEKLKEKLSHVLNMIGISVYTAKDILAYTFLLPILGMIISVVTEFGLNSVEFSTLVEAILTSGLITTSGVVVKDALQKIAKIISKKS